MDIINELFSHHRYETIINGRHNLKDWIEKYEGQPSVQSVITYKMLRGISYDKSLQQAFQIYSSGGSVSMFPPKEAVRLYNILGSKSVLDPCAGWGGRCLGAMICKINYLGFDTNLALQDAYQELIARHKPEGTDVRVVFKDSSTISSGDVPGEVDTIFTSPPYWSSPRVLKERYEYMPVYENEEDFNSRFLSPMVRTTWNLLKPGGYFCINTNLRQYEDLKKIIGREADRFIELVKSKRGRDDKYKEYIYVWRRGA